MKKIFKREIFFFLLLICAKPSFCEIDSDNDGMPDDWELFYNLDIYSDDSFSENDSDYFYNLNEYFFQTDPTNPDTDNDGLLDGEEAQYIDDPFLYSAENGIYYQLFPAVCSNGTDYLLTWVDYGYDPYDGEIIGIILDGAGNPKTWEFMINTNTVGWQDAPRVCSNGGKYLVVWVDGNPGSPLEGKGMDIAGQFIDSSGSKIGSEFQINSYTTGDQCACCAVPIGDNFLVVWVNNLPGDIKTEIQGQIIDQNGQKIGQEININSYHTGKQEIPAVASNGQRCLVAWSSFADGQWDVYAQILDNEGGKIGSEFRINDYTDNDQSTPAIASDGKNFMITWKSRGQDGDVYGIYAKQIDSDGNTIKPEFRINETTQNAQMYSSICFNGRYYFIAWVDGIWYEEYGQAIFNEVRASSFDNEGRIMLHETSFRIFSDSDDYISQQRFPVIATFGSDFFITWWNSDIEWYEDKVYYYDYIAGKMVNPGYGTDPANSDSDEDNLCDGDEIRLYNTDPLNSDTDGDYISDGDEINLYKTNPAESDSDNDGLFDFEEVKIRFFDGFESGGFGSLGWNREGNMSWVIYDNDSYEGTFCAGSPSGLPDDQYSTLEITVNLPVKSKLSFCYRVSSEEYFDFLQLIVNNSVVEQWSGEIPWTVYTLDQPLNAGTNTIIFRYSKDSTIGEGLDRAFIDNFTVENITYGTDSAKADSDGDGMKDGAEIYAGTDPLDPASVFAVKSVSIIYDGEQEYAVKITWKCSDAPGRTYKVKSKPCSGSQWENCEGIIIDNGNGTMSWTGMDSQIIGAGVSGSKIYKVAVTKVQ